MNLKKALAKIEKYDNYATGFACDSGVLYFIEAKHFDSRLEVVVREQHSFGLISVEKHFAGNVDDFIYNEIINKYPFIRESKFNVSLFSFSEPNVEDICKRYFDIEDNIQGDQLYIKCMQEINKLNS